MVIIKNNDDIEETRIHEQDVRGARLRVLIGPEDGSDNIVMRLIRVEPQGQTPFHSHPHEHVVKVESGEGVVVDKDGREIPIRAGQSLFIAGNEKHRFRNPGPGALEFLCVIPNIGND